jgi:hypothetical protein
MSDLTFTFTLDHEPKDMENIKYPGPEDYTIQVTYEALSLGSCIISSIYIIKPLKEEDYYTADGNFGKKIKFTEHYLTLKIGLTQLRQALGETITIKFTNMRETSGPRKELRFDTYTISTKDIHLMYTNITFDKYHVNTINSADYETAFVRAPPAPPPPPSVNISKIIPSIQEILKESPSLTVKLTPSNKIQISNPEHTLLAFIEDNKFTYFMPKVYTEKLTGPQEAEIGKLFVGGRRKPKRRTNRNKKRRRTHRV